MCFLRQFAIKVIKEIRGFDAFAASGLIAFPSLRNINKPPGWCWQKKNPVEHLNNDETFHWLSLSAVVLKGIRAVPRNKWYLRMSHRSRSHHQMSLTFCVSPQCLAVITARPTLQTAYHDPIAAHTLSRAVIVRGRGLLWTTLLIHPITCNAPLSWGLWVMASLREIAKEFRKVRCYKYDKFPEAAISNVLM